MNCLLMRELSLSLIIRLWDTYLSEEGGDGFKVRGRPVLGFGRVIHGLVRLLRFRPLVVLPPGQRNVCVTFWPSGCPASRVSTTTTVDTNTTAATTATITTRQVFHIYACTAFLIGFADHLKSMEFQDLVRKA